MGYVYAYTELVLHQVCNVLVGRVWILRKMFESIAEGNSRCKGVLIAHTHFRGRW